MRFSLRLILVSVLFLICESVGLAAGVQVIPAPQSAEMTDKEFNRKNLDKIKYVKLKTLPAEAYEMHILRNSGKNDCIMRITAG